jgi:predicted amidohydrolase
MPEKPMTVMVAAIQCSAYFGAVEKNRTKLSALVERAAKKGAKIIVLPESSITGYLSQDLHKCWHVQGRPIEPAFTGHDPRNFAEEVPGPSTRHFSELARRLGVYITVPFVEVAYRPKSPVEDGSVTSSVDSSTVPVYFNTVCLVSPKGDLVAHYRKLKPWPYPEKSWATPGDHGLQVYDTEYGRIGLAICYDIHSILKKYEPYKIWALLYPIAWVDKYHPAEWFWHTLPPRVAAYHHYLIGANWSVDKRQPWRGYGFSVIISPNGEILASSHKLYGSDIVYATIPTEWAGDLSPGTGHQVTAKDSAVSIRQNTP